MTEDKIRRIRDHIEIHARREPQSIKITQILWEAVEELEQFEKLKCCGNCKNRDEDIYGRFVCKYRNNYTHSRNDICRCNSKWELCK